MFWECENMLGKVLDWVLSDKTRQLTGVSEQLTKILMSENALYPILPGQTAFLGFSFIHIPPEINNKHQKNHP